MDSIKWTLPQVTMFLPIRCLLSNLSLILLPSTHPSSHHLITTSVPFSSNSSSYPLKLFASGMLFFKCLANIFIFILLDCPTRHFFFNIFSPSCNHRPEVWWYGHILLCHGNIPTIFPLRPIKWCRVTACVSAEVASPWPRMSKTTLIYFLSYLIVLARQTAAEVRPRITAGPGSWPVISTSSILVVSFEFWRFVFLCVSCVSISARN